MGRRIRGAAFPGLLAALLLAVAASRAQATTIVITFEDFPDAFAQTAFPASYAGLTWTNWQHYAPLAPYQPNGQNAIFAGPAGGANVNSFAFTDTVFTGAWFSLSPFAAFQGTVQFQLFLDNTLVHTSTTLSSIVNDPSLRFLPSGYSGLVDEVRVVTSAGLIPTDGNAAWIMDDVTFEAVPEPGSLLLLGSGLASAAAWHRRRGRALSRNTSPVSAARRDI